jgi:hypothetical protein
MTDPKPQSDKFKDMARELEADAAPEHFERVVQHIVAAPIPPKEAKPVRDRK